MPNKIRGDRVRELRKGLHLSQYDLEGELQRLGADVKQSWISQVENNRAGLRPSNLAKLATVLNTSTDYLLGVTDDPTPRDDLENQVMLVEHDPERRAQLQIIFTKVAKMSPDMRQEYYDVLEVLYRGMIAKSRQERD